MNQRIPMYSDVNGVKQDERGISYKVLMVGGIAVRVDQHQPRRVGTQDTIHQDKFHSPRAFWPWPVSRTRKAKRKVEVKRG